MDFSAYNPLSTNSLNLAARNNDVDAVKRLLKTNNPNCVDNRGWTCLHEAAACDSYESLLLILKHQECRPLSETYEGHTALYLACQKGCSLKTITALLDNVEDIANYASTEMVTPLHVVSAQGRIEVVQLLLDYGAYIDVLDFDGDTALHDAAFAIQKKVVNLLLHAGSHPNIKNDAGYTPFHLACFKGCLETVKVLHNFVEDVNQQTGNGETPLMLATHTGSKDVVEYLLEQGADPHIRNYEGELPLKISLIHGASDVFKMLLPITNINEIPLDIILQSFKPHLFNMAITITLLQSDLDDEFFHVGEKFYVVLEEMGNYKPHYEVNAPMNNFLHVSEYIYNWSPDAFLISIYLYLTKGVSVNATHKNECPPLVYLHYCDVKKSFEDVFNILIEHGCDVDYRSFSAIPDALVASVATGGASLPYLIRHSLHCDPDFIIKFIIETNMVERVKPLAIEKVLSHIDIYSEGLTMKNLHSFVPSLKHLCRLRIRQIVRATGDKTSSQYLGVLDQLPLPAIIKNFLRFGTWDPDEFPVEDLVKAGMAMGEIGIRQPKLQILGGTVIVDLEGITVKHISTLTPTIAYQIVALMGTATPLRMRQCHIINYSWVLNTFFYLFKRFIPKSAWKAINFHGSDLKSLQKHIKPEYLPAQYGGTCKNHVSIGEWFGKIKKYRDAAFDAEMKALGYVIKE